MANNNSINNRKLDMDPNMIYKIKTNPISQEELLSKFENGQLARLHQFADAHGKSDKEAIIWASKFYARPLSKESFVLKWHQKSFTDLIGSTPVKIKSYKNKSNSNKQKPDRAYALYESLKAPIDQVLISDIAKIYEVEERIIIKWAIDNYKRPMTSDSFLYKKHNKYIAKHLKMEVRNLTPVKSKDYSTKPSNSVWTVKLK